MQAGRGVGLVRHCHHLNTLTGVYSLKNASLTVLNSSTSGAFGLEQGVAARPEGGEDAHEVVGLKLLEVGLVLRRQLLA
eukprot:63315-Rhodomonas_salina.1